MSELLRVEHVSAGYGEAVVLNDISLSLAEGETLALLGRNGTGKTTIVNALSYALFGNALTNIKKDNLINKINNKIFVFFYIVRNWDLAIIHL